MANLSQTPTGSNPLPGAVAYDTLKDSMGRFRTLSLFVENKHEKYPAPYSLKPYNHRGAMSMYQIYMDVGDPTEYTQAIALLGSWKHWTLLSECEWFKPLLKEWRNELETKFESDRFLEMEDVAKTHKGTPQGVSATKWLAERYSTVRKPKRGRPSKAEKKAALIEETEDDKLHQEDAERLGL